MKKYNLRTEIKMESFVTVIYDKFVMPTKIKDLTNKFSSGVMADKQKEGCEVEKLQYEKCGPTTTICNKVENDENPFLSSVLALEIDQKVSRNKATCTTVDLGKVREGSNPTAQLQPKGKKEKDLNKDKGEVGALNKDATSSPPLEKEQDEMTTDKERDRAFNRDVKSSPSFEKKEEIFNADKIGPKASDEVAMFSPSFEKKEGHLNADKIGPKASGEVALSSPDDLERGEENLYTSKKSYKATNENKFKDKRFEKRRADSAPSKDLSPFIVLLQLFQRIISSKIGMVLLLLCFASLVIGKSEGNQEPNCDPPKEPISKLYFLKQNKTCMSLNVNLQCANGLIAVCLPVVPGSDLAVGCARDRPINGKGCPEWNNDNGCYVLNVRHNECETCSDYYLLSNSSEVAKCFKDERATTIEQTTVTSAKGTRDKRSSLDHGVQTTAASPNKTSRKSEGNNESEIAIIIVAVVMLVGTPFVIVAVIKVRNRRRNPNTEQEQTVEGSAPEELQPVAGSNPEQQQPFIRSNPEQQQPFVRFDPEQQRVFPPNGMIYESVC